MQLVDNDRATVAAGATRFGKRGLQERASNDQPRKEMIIRAIQHLPCVVEATQMKKRREMLAAALPSSEPLRRPCSVCAPGRMHVRCVLDPR